MWRALCECSGNRCGMPWWHKGMMWGSTWTKGGGGGGCIYWCTRAANFCWFLDHVSKMAGHVFCSIQDIQSPAMKKPWDIMHGYWPCVDSKSQTRAPQLPCFGKRKQVTKVTFLVKEWNVSVVSTDINLEYHELCYTIDISRPHSRMSVYA